MANSKILGTFHFSFPVKIPRKKFCYKKVVMMFEVIMIDGHCPSETCSMGLCETREAAEALIAKEAKNYRDHMIFEIEEKYCA